MGETHRAGQPATAGRGTGQASGPRAGQVAKAGERADAASWLATPRATRQVLEAFGLATKHRLGQNFLVNPQVIERILELAQVTAQDVVLEVGPGIGTLTVALLPRAAAVVSVEADLQLEPVLAQTCGSFSTFALVMGDALRMTAERLRQALGPVVPAGVEPVPDLFVANLPYQVAATLVLQAFQDLPSLRRAVVMVQKEVADRIAAGPGVKDYGAYTVKLRLYAQVTGRFEVRPANFMPPPRVDSAVVRLDRAPVCDPQTGEPLGAERLGAVCRVVDAAFCQRRKTIRNSMAAAGFSKDVLDRAFTACGIDPGCRAETLTPEQFVALERALQV